MNAAIHSLVPRRPDDRSARAAGEVLLRRGLR